MRLTNRSPLRRALALAVLLASAGAVGSLPAQNATAGAPRRAVGLAGMPVPDSDAWYARDLAARRAPVDEAAFARQFRHDTVRVNGVAVHYVTGGRGAPLVLLHGWTQTWRAWRRVMPALAARYTLVVPDLRGFGDSEKPAGPYDNRTAAEDVYQLARALGHPRFDLVGHDVGAPVAYALAAGHGDAVRRLVLFEGLPPGFSAPGGEGGASAVWHPAFHAVRGLPETLVAGREKAYLSYFFRTFTYDSTTFDDAEIEAYARAYARPGALRSGFEYYRARAENERANRVFGRRPLAMPVLAFGGERSVGQAMPDAARRFATDVQGGVVGRAGHFVAEERPAYFTALLLTFLGGAEPKAVARP